jgi:hypothetical protein
MEASSHHLRPLYLDVDEDDDLLADRSGLTAL